MSIILPINIEDLLNCQGVESSRIEFKAGWGDETTGFQVLKTICAFANDLQNLNGGYIIIGVEGREGRAVLPPKGLSPEKIDHIQKWVRGNSNRIDPEFQPVMSPEVVSGRQILVIWAPGSDTRPHRAPEAKKGGERKYFVRIGSETVDADKNGVLGDLMQLTAKVPFDDRRTLQATTDDLRESRVREFLNDIRSGLLEEENTRAIYRKLRITSSANGHDVPRNIGLLLFSEDPDIWFPGTRIEVVQFADDASGNVIEEKIFRGGIHEQLKNALAFLETISSPHLEKQEHSFRVKGWVSYPVPALREALVNAVYHKSYEPSLQEPVKVYLYPDRIEIISYPGPVRGIELAHLHPDASVPSVPARNRRIGEFLKELHLAEGRGTGLPRIYRAMQENGSQIPSFDFDEGRSYFRVMLPAHPEYIAISALRDAAHLKALGNDADAFRRIENAWKSLPASPSLASEYIRLLGANEQLEDAKMAFSEFKEQTPDHFHHFVSNVLIDTLLDAGRNDEAKKLLDRQPMYLASDDAMDAAILARRLRDEEKAHRYFERAGDAVLNDVRALHEFAQTKIKLANKIAKSRRNRNSNRRLLHEAKELLERAVQMDASRVRHAWAWRDLGRVKKWLKHPTQEVTAAYERAIELHPEEKEFKKELAWWKKTPGWNKGQGNRQQ